MAIPPAPPALVEGALAAYEGRRYGPRAMLKTNALTTIARTAGSLALAGILIGCPKAEEKAKPEKTVKKAPVKAPEKPATPSANADCFAPWKADGEKAEMKIGTQTFERVGTKLTETSADDDNKTVLGVLANIKEDTPENLKNLEELLKFFDESKVDAIVIAGDIGETQSQIENALMPIAAKGLPTFVVIGNREKKSDFNDAVSAVAAKHPNLINLNLVRLVALDDVALVSVPGYYDQAYIHAEDGCHYSASDVEATAAIVKAAGKKPVIVVSHGPPKQDGDNALDRTLEQANVGDPALTAMLKSAGVKLGIFANIQESGGRATNLDGTQLIGEGDMAAELFLNPGAADAVSWKMNDGTRSVGMAAVMTIHGQEASFATHRIAE